MLYLLQPNYTFHLWSLMFFLIYMLIHMKWEPSCKKQTLVSTLGLIFMYMGLLFFNSIIEFTFLPYYVVSCIGLRNRWTYIFVCSIVLGIHLYTYTVVQIISHILMNLGRLMKKDNITAVCFFMTHWSMAVIYFFFIPYHETPMIVTLIACVSSVLCFYLERFDSIDLFSTSMIFASNNYWTLLKIIIIQILEMDWFYYYENNHFMHVQKSYTFIIPVGVLIFCLFYE